MPMRLEILRTRLLAAGIAAALLASGAHAQTAQRKVGQKPEPGVEATVTVGSPLLERYNMIVVPGIQLETNVDVDLGIQGHIRISMGTPLTITSDSGKLRACTVAEDTYIASVGGRHSASCLTDKDKDGRFDTVESAALFLTTKKLSPPAPYARQDVPENVGANNSRVTLVYLGAAAGVLRLSYREFANDMARPAFTEELSYPVGAAFPQTITWRDTKITLLGLSNDGLRYRVEAGK